MELAPIVLFVYNRPWHTLQTLEALANNHLAGHSKLYIYADGAKEGTPKETLKNIKEVRRIIKQKKWCDEVQIIENSQNKGLANSIIEGVTEVINRYGKIIVLEDDLVTSPGFLAYMNDALSVYEKEGKVMHVGGYIPPVKVKASTSVFCIRFASSWGWGTWKDRWSQFELSASKLIEAFDEEAVQKFNIESSYHFYKMLQECHFRKNDSWAIRWYATIFLNQGLAIYPKNTLIKNIGMDNSGVHCVPDKRYKPKQIAKKIEVIKIQPMEDVQARKAFKKFYGRLSKPWLIDKINYKISLILTKYGFKSFAYKYF